MYQPRNLFSVNLFPREDDDSETGCKSRICYYAAVALVFPVLMLGGLWNLGLDGIWLNMFGTSFLALLLGGGLLLHVFAASKRKTDYYD